MSDLPEAVENFIQDSLVVIEYLIEDDIKEITECLLSNPDSPVRKLIEAANIVCGDSAGFDDFETLNNALAALEVNNE